MEWTPEDIVKTASQTSAAIGAGWVVWRKVAKRFIAWRESTDLAGNLRKQFGQNPPEAIRKLIDDLTNRADAMEVRQNIICDKAGIGIYMCGLDARCTYANPKLCEIFGRGKDDMIGWGWLGSIEKFDADRVREAWVEAVKERLPYRESYKLRNGKSVQTEAFLLHSQQAYVGYVMVSDK